MNKYDLLPHDMVCSLYKYKDGKIYNKFSRGGAIKGSEAGSTTKQGYKLIRFERRFYFVHRVVWIMHNGRWPAGNIDHIDGDRLNNRIENLREATYSQNAHNQPRNSRNTSGYKGVHFWRNRWRAEIYINNKRIRLGSFNTPEQAHEAYCKAADEYFGEFANHG